MSTAKNKTDLEGNQPSLPLVSVLISCFNHERFVKDAIQSVLDQDYPNIELLVADDGSTDNSPEILGALLKECGFKFFRRTNHGLCQSLNFLAGESKGELLVSFGSDDVMLPHRIRTQVDHMLANPSVGICGGLIEIMDSEGQPVEPRYKHLPSKVERLTFDDLIYDRKPAAGAPTLMFRKDRFLQAGGFDPDLRLEDIYLTWKICSTGSHLDILPKFLTRYRKHPENTYKKINFMYEELCKTYLHFSNHPGYEALMRRHRRSFFIKAMNAKDLTLAKRIFHHMSLSEMDLRILIKSLKLFVLRF